MTGPRNDARARKRRSPPRLSDLVLPVAVLGSIALVLGLTDWRGRSDAVQRMEAREPAMLPDTPRSISALYHYPAEFSRFMDDHYGLRQDAIDLRTRVWFWLLRDVFAANVMIGRDHWLFFASTSEARDMLHADPLPAATVEDWAERIEERRRWLAARGIRYLFVVAPNKQTVYPEMLPRLHPRPGPTRRQQLDTRLSGQDSFFDLTDAMRAEKPAGLLYYQWDTHWNFHGAYVGYAATMRDLDRIPEPADMGTGFVPRDLLGDLGRLSGLKLMEYDRAPSAPCAKPLPSSAKPAMFSNPFDESEPVYAVPATVCASGAGRLLMFHDSFAGMWAPWLSTQFARAVYIWRPPSFAELKRMVELEHPTVVIEERLERFLIWPLRP